MRDDDVVRQVREAREAYAKSFGYDLKAMVADLRNQDAKGDRTVVRLAPRRPPGAAVLPVESDPANRQARPNANARSGSVSGS